METANKGSLQQVLTPVLLTQLYGPGSLKQAKESPSNTIVELELIQVVKGLCPGKGPRHHPIL